jgi:hypothetical protein
MFCCPCAVNVPWRTRRIPRCPCLAKDPRGIAKAWMEVAFARTTPRPAGSPRADPNNFLGALRGMPVHVLLLFSVFCFSCCHLFTEHVLSRNSMYVRYTSAFSKTCVCPPFSSQVRHLLTLGTYTSVSLMFSGYTKGFHCLLMSRSIYKRTLLSCVSSVYSGTPVHIKYGQNGLEMTVSCVCQKTPHFPSPARHSVKRDYYLSRSLSLRTVTAVGHVTHSSPRHLPITSSQDARLNIGVKLVGS